MKGTKKLSWLRTAAVLLAGGLVLIVGGDRGYTALPPGAGVDPLQILDLQIKPNVLVVVDTSGSMRFPPNTSIGGTTADLNIGGDDPVAKMYQAKTALKQVLNANASTINFGIAQYGVLNVDKVLTQPLYPNSAAQNVLAGGNGKIGPLTYVSLDANADFWTGGASGSGGGDFFVSTMSSTVDYLGTTSGPVYNSFRPFNEVFPGDGCTVGTNCRRYLFSRLLRDNVKFRWDRGSGSAGLQAGYPQAITCPLPPAGIFPQDPNVDADPTRTDVRRPCFQLESTVAGETPATFYYTSGNWEFTSGSCTAAAVLRNVAPCNDATTVGIIQGFLKPELPIDGTCGDAVGIPCGMTSSVNVTGTAFQGTNPATTNADSWLGLLSAQATPLGGVLANVRTNFNTYFPNQLAGQRNFVLLLTDGDETCGGAPATEAQTNWNNNPRIETLVIGFGLNSSTLNQIARNGSGGVRDAYTASNIQDLIDALNAALQQASTSGTFADQQSITESVFELTASIPPTPSVGMPPRPRDPADRYNVALPLLLQSSFDLPGFDGHLKAFRNNGGVSALVWDAGQKLSSGMTGGPWSFGELHGGAFSTLPTGVGASSAKIKRRIYTTSQNGVNAPLVPLWPPSTANNPTPGVAPTTSSIAGSLDQALGIDVLTFAQMSGAPYYACMGSNLPTGCSTSTASAARKEVREMILANMAGARAVRESNGYPTRFAGASPVPAADRRQIRYEAKPWAMAEGTLSAPAVVAPPYESVPEVHSAEYTLYRDGPRNAGGQAVNCLNQGFGLRNPDKDGTALSRNSSTLKPVMSTVYLGSNDMLHAFRAGPCVSSSGANTCDVGGGTETGGEELWGFVPFDQLSKLKDRLVAPTRANHTYMIASPVRIADVFVPGSFTSVTGCSATISGSGRWRTMAYFGRGAGGNYYTALDVTVPGSFTTAALSTNPPAVAWSRGYPDTTLGANGGSPNATTNPNIPPDLGATDATAYGTMGQTWSVPAVARVTPATNFGKEFVLYSGSGYSTDASQGHNVYVMDALTGDILTSVDVGSANGGTIQNVVVASPAAYEETIFSCYYCSPPQIGLVERVYVGDLHGRIWKFLTDSPSTAILFQDLGVQQPIATAAGILGYDGDNTGRKAHVYVETGKDYRIPTPPATAPPPVFRLLGLRDDAADTDTTTPGTLLFSNDFSDGYRGIVQPATALGDPLTLGNEKGRVFFSGTKFNPAGLNCTSSFDSEIWALAAATGGAAYDLNLSGSEDAGDLKLSLTGSYVNALQSAFGVLVVDQGLNAQVPPPPPAESTPPTASNTSDVFVKSMRPTTTVCK